MREVRLNHSMELYNCRHECKDGRSQRHWRSEAAAVAGSVALSACRIFNQNISLRVWITIYNFSYHEHKNLTFFDTPGVLNSAGEVAALRRVPRRRALPSRLCSR